MRKQLVVKKRKKTFEIISPVPRYAPAHRRWATYYLLIFLFVSFIMLVIAIGYHEMGSPNLAFGVKAYSIYSRVLLLLTRPARSGLVDSVPS
jgi:hypothetical protein